MKPRKTRHGVRADGKTQTSISLRGDLLAAARAAAEKENRSLSNWLETLLMEKLTGPPSTDAQKDGREDG